MVSNRPWPTGHKGIGNRKSRTRCWQLASRQDLNWPLAT